MPHPSSLKPYIPKKLPIAIAMNRELERALARTHKELENYNTSLQRIPHLKEVVRACALKEARASTSLSCVKTGVASRNHKQAIHAILSAFEYARKALEKRPFSKTLLCTIHAHIKRSRATNQSKLGHYRTTQNWIGPQGCSPVEAYYLPPPPTRVDSSMKQWLTYCNQTTDEPLLQLSLLVAQLLIIHPFMDGNGRIARLMVPLFLYRKGVLAAPCLFLSHYIQRNRLSYLRALYEITAEGNWHTWILFFLKGLRSVTTHKHLIKSKSHSLNKAY